MPEIFTPDTEAQLRDVVAWALNARAPCRIHGHDSKAGLGAPVNTAHTIDLSRLNGIIAYAPEELVLTAQAGTPMAAITALLRANRQHLAFEPPDWGPHFGAMPGRGTIGGIVSCNASGPRRFKSGAARDHFLGFTAVNGRAEIFRAGGRVVKNVTGYDLPKLFAGAYGRLGIMTEVTLKTMPAPSDSATLVLRDLDDGAALSALRVAAASPLEPSGLAHLPAGLNGGRAQTLFRLEGPFAAVTDRHNRLKALLDGMGEWESLGADAAGALWQRVRDADFFAGDTQPLWRLSVPPREGAMAAAQIAPQKYYYDWAGGLIWLLSDNVQRVREAAKQTGGHATLFRAADQFRLSVPAFEPQTAALSALEQRVREGFDPFRIFNPAGA
ncbi:MAG: glycolate oxidase subunit GlcE [Alphaproteobacteria bacterium]